MCGLGVLVPKLSWQLIGWVWLYNLVWMFILGGVRLMTERLLDHRTSRRIRSQEIVSQSLIAPMAIETVPQTSALH
jgi:H+-transporting ATPase